LIHVFCGTTGPGTVFAEMLLAVLAERIVF